MGAHSRPRGASGTSSSPQRADLEWGAVIVGIAHGLNRPSFYAMFVDIVPLHQRAAFMSINGMVMRVGQTLGPLAMALCFAAWGITGL